MFVPCLSWETYKPLEQFLPFNPPLEAIDEGKFDGTLHLLIASDAGEEALITVASGTDIAEVEIRPAGKRNSTS